jgi:chaperonin GroES
VGVTTSFKPLGDRVVIRPIEKDEVTKSGLVLPDTAKEKPQEGEVTAVGPGRLGDDGKRIAMEVKVGDTVVYSKYAGTELKEDEEDYLIVRESDILAKIG